MQKNREHRKQMYNAYLNRGRRGNECDNCQLAQRIATLRIEKANILGFDNYASYILQNSMAKSPVKVLEFLDEIWGKLQKSAQSEAQILQDKMNRDGIEGDLQVWDWWYYTEQVRAEKYAFEDNEVKPYFSTDRVLEGALSVAEKLFHLEFKETKDLPIYHPQVKTFQVLKKNSTEVIGILYIDYYTRPSKRGGAWDE